jgi:5-methylcytosine-specific restriction endonuclease McrA
MPVATTPVLYAPPKIAPCPAHGLGGGTAVHICIPLREVFQRLEAALDGHFAPEEARPEPHKPPAAPAAPDPTSDTSPGLPTRLRANPGLPALPGGKPIPTPSKRRVCVACKRSRRIRFFYVNRKARGGRAIYCRDCWQRRAGARRKANLARHREWSRKANEVYRGAGKDAVCKERYRLSYKGLLTQRMMMHRRRSKEQGVAFDISKTELKALVKKWFGRCAYCNQSCPDFHFDHVIPIQKDGPTIPANLVPACRVCNRYKGKKNIYALLHSGWFSKPKRIERVLAHCTTARGADRIASRLKDLMKDAGVGDPVMDLLEPWLREAVTSGYISKEDAVVAMREMGEEGLSNLHELYERFHRGEAEKERRTG